MMRVPPPPANLHGTPCGHIWAGQTFHEPALFQRAQFGRKSPSADDAVHRHPGRVFQAIFLPCPTTFPASVTAKPQTSHAFRVTFPASFGMETIDEKNLARCPAPEPP